MFLRSLCALKWSLKTISVSCICRSRVSEFSPRALIAVPSPGGVQNFSVMIAFGHFEMPLHMQIGLTAPIFLESHIGLERALIWMFPFQNLKSCNRSLHFGRHSVDAPLMRHFQILIEATAQSHWSIYACGKAAQGYCAVKFTLRILESVPSCLALLGAERELVEPLRRRLRAATLAP